MTPAQRHASFRALLVGALAGAVLFSIVFAKTRAITAPRYRLTVSVVAQGLTAGAAANDASAPVMFVTGVLQANGLRARHSVDNRPAVGSNGKLDGSYIHEVALTAIASNQALLDRVSSEIQSSARWRVIALSQAGEFVPARTAHGVHLWRLRSAGSENGARRRVWIQINDPAAAVTYSDYFMFAFIVMLMISFGSLEGNNNDPRAFPAGMHPAVIASQMLLFSLLLCWLWICYAGGYMGAIFLAIAFLGAASLVWWGLKTRRYWIAV